MAQKKQLHISSSSFKQGEMIASRYTCDGEDVNPPLHIEGIPNEAECLAIIVDDPDAPSGTWVHWVIWNIPVTEQIEEGHVEGIQGMNDFSKHQFNGPCPPKGKHRYFFKVYALDKKLDIPVSSNKDDLENAMKSHIVAYGELMGVYQH